MQKACIKWRYYREETFFCCVCLYSQSLTPFRYKETTDLHSESLRNSKTLPSVEDLAVSKFIKADFGSVTR